jgi:hypothetical protein
LLLEEIELLQTAIKVVSNVIPRVAIEMDVFVGPDICQVAVIVSVAV